MQKSKCMGGDAGKCWGVKNLAGMRGWVAQFELSSREDSEV